jgi:hypothetical protein
MSVGTMPDAAAYGMPVMKAWTQLRRLSAVKMLMAGIHLVKGGGRGMRGAPARIVHKMSPA